MKKVNLQFSRFRTHLRSNPGQSMVEFAIVVVPLLLLAMGVAEFGRGNFEAEYGYDIPYRCLVPANIDGLLFGARCISVEDDGADESLTALNAHRGITATIVVSQASGVAGIRLKEGDRVEFNVVQGSKGSQASDVVVH